MRRHVFTVLTLIGLAATSGSALADTAALPDLGRWLTASGNLEIDIEPCGEKLCGKVVKVLGNRSMSDPSQQMQPADPKQVMGMQILSDFKPSGDSKWQGQIYNRENGKTYDCRMTLLSPQQLEIRAYKFLPVFGKTQVWTRVAE